MEAQQRRRSAGHDPSGPTTRGGTTPHPDGPPSLREAERLVVHGDVTFGADVRVRGAVELDAHEPTRIDAGVTLEG